MKPAIEIATEACEKLRPSNEEEIILLCVELIEAARAESTAEARTAERDRCFLIAATRGGEWRSAWRTNTHAAESTLREWSARENEAEAICNAIAKREKS